MGSNSLGKIFTYSSFGESHGPAIGVLIDGCPAGVKLDIKQINKTLARRAPGQSEFTSPRAEKDRAEIISGVFEGQSTGAPICIIIKNKDADSSKYSDIAKILRPGHANLTYLTKYGSFDYRGGGRASARETAARVAAGALAEAMLKDTGLKVFASLTKVGKSFDYSTYTQDNLDSAMKYGPESKLFAPSLEAEKELARQILDAKEAKDSVGGIVSYFILSPPTGLGDPVYDKLNARLAHALMSIPASKGFEIGLGFKAAEYNGSQFNDGFIKTKEGIRLSRNKSGGILGGISTGNTIYGQVAFKPTSSIELEQESLNLDGEAAKFQLPEDSRHDPCVAVRAVPVVEAMCWLTIADLYLQNKNATI